MVQLEEHGFRGRDGALQSDRSGFKSYLCYLQSGGLEPVTKLSVPCCK